MGEAKKKRQRKERFLEQHPFCCFCGGATPATTTDHVPSRQMFSLRRRPKGLEVPACDSCNNATRQHEQVAAMLGRLYPDGGTMAEKEETGNIMGAVNSNNPGLLEEMMPSQRQQRRFVRANINPADVGGVLNCSGPLLNRSIEAFGAKLGYALYYETTGLIVPSVGGVAVRWYSNFDALAGNIPAEFLATLGPPQTLRQGRWEASEQFGYAFAVTEISEMAVYYSTFRKSFAVVSWVSDDISRFRGVDNIKIYRPGQF